MYEPRRIPDAIPAVKPAGAPHYRAQSAVECLPAPVAVHRLANISIAAFPAAAQSHDVIQRVKSKSELAKAFTALGQDAEVATLPSPSYGQELNERISAAKSPEERQAVLAAVQHAYGIGGHGESIEYDTEVEEEGETEPDKTPRVGPQIFAESVGPVAHLRMALTLNHENLHRRQYQRIGETHLAYGPKGMSNQVSDAIKEAARQEAMLREVFAYESELSTIASYRATFYASQPAPDDIEAELVKFENDATIERDDHFAQAAFTQEQQAFFKAGDFAGLLVSIRKAVPEGTTRYSLSEADWSDIVDATAILEQMKVVGAKLAARPTTALRRKWQFFDRALETRFYRANVSHWLLVRSPGDMATLDVRAEVEKVLREADLSRLPGFWDRVSASAWMPKANDSAPELGGESD